MPESFFIDLPFRVRYAETDRMGIAYYANHLVWFEMGRSEYCRAGGYPYKKIEDDGYIMVVASASIRYKRPAHYDDPLIVRTTMPEISRRIARFEYQIIHEETKELIAEGETTHVVVDKESGRPVRMPQRYVDQLSARPAASIP